MIFIKVDFPEPDGPVIEIKSFSYILNETSSNAFTTVSPRL